MFNTYYHANDIEPELESDPDALSGPEKTETATVDVSVLLIDM